MAKEKVVIILPTYNEKENITRLLNKLILIRKSLKRVNLHILVIDDTSPDGTADEVQKIKKSYGFIHLIKDQKKAGFGKAYIKGFRYASKSLKANIVVQMDSDLSHNPHDIPRLLNELQKGHDVAIGSRYIFGGRIPEKWGLKRRINSRLGNLLAQKFEGLSEIKDCTGGFRAIRVDSLKKINFNNLEINGYVFQIALLSALNKANAKVKEVPITFSERSEGASKLRFKDQREFVSYLVLKKIRHSWVTTKIFGERPFHFHTENEEDMRGAGVFHKKKKYVTHTTLHHKNSAVRTLNSIQKFILSLTVICIAVGLIMNWQTTLIILFSILILLYFIDLFFNIILIFRSFLTEPEIKISELELENINEKTLPTFTILCPLYKEQSILPQFIEAMSSLDYPKEKLEIFLLFEEDDIETISVAKRLSPPAYIQSMIVPLSFPKTKPKALNYGLSHSRGDIIVIYDAEDIPEKDQLKKATLAFEKVGNKVFCLQAKLNFYNPQQNVLTRLFTAEYSTWFDLILTGLYSINAPIPLGGTSNFFRRKDILSVEAWDAFNVCEDCDLGMRLFKRGYQTALFNSTTFEEANSNLGSWIRQRSHWIKGYIQGFFVHLRSPGGFLTSLKEPHLFTFILVVGGKTLSVFINPLLWIMTISYFLLRPITGSFIESLYPTSIFYMGLITLVVGNFLYLYNYMLGCARRGYWHLIGYAWFIPIYWLLMSFAAWKAVYQIFIKPHYWEKTTHGLHLAKKI